MSDDILKQQVATQLDVQNLYDLRALMDTQQGRRFFQWLLLKCGRNNTSFTRDSRTYFNEGMRNVALLLESSMKAIGLEGVDLLHQSEREYIELSEAIKRQILDQGGDGHGKV
ncbi:MAG: hypothetical protein H6Q73_193 [Firmicutes bacterium]|nr:hypothetical protein [Bacillota bacterium]